MCDVNRKMRKMRIVILGTAGRLDTQKVVNRMTQECSDCPHDWSITLRVLAPARRWSQGVLWHPPFFPALSPRRTRGVIRVLIADSEVRSRRSLHLYLEREPDVQVVAEVADGREAADAIFKWRPDLLFLDVQIPALEELQALERVTDERQPVVVLVTSYDVHALMAFELQALDYLLKPYSPACVDKSLRRVRADLADPSSPGRAKVSEVLEKLKAARRGGTRAGVLPQRFAVREGDRITLVKSTDLQAVEAAGNYVKLVVLTGDHLLRLTLSEMEQQLDPARFVRIHRSTLINTEHVEEIRLSSHGDCEVVLKNGAIYRVSRGHREKLLAAYGGA